MTVVGTTKDPEALTLTIVAELAAPPARVWLLWSDPRQLERWWGPPCWPATFDEHDLRAGGRASYYMTGPAGEKMRGCWQVLAVEEPRRIEYEDWFANDAGEPDDAMPVTNGVVELDGIANGTRMTVTTTFRSVADMERVLRMGMVEGMTQALGQIDALLAEG